MNHERNLINWTSPKFKTFAFEGNKKEVAFLYLEAAQMFLPNTFQHFCRLRDKQREGGGAGAERKLLLHYWASCPEQIFPLWHRGRQGGDPQAERGSSRVTESGRAPRP